MKKIAMFFFIIIIIVAAITYMFLVNKANYNNTQRENREYENYYNKELLGNELTTIINRAINNNKLNEVQTDNKGKFIDNQTNSIHIEVKIIDNDTTYTMEQLYIGDMSNFVKFYSEITFKCTKMEYHKNNKIKYMLFEQITE